MPDDNGKAPQGLGPPGWNPLFVGVLVGLVLGLVAGLCAGTSKPGSALHSNAVFRVQVGFVVAFAAYAAAAALWLAWHKTLFQRFGFGNAGLEPPDKQQALAERDDKIDDFMSETTETVDEFRARIEALEDSG